MLVFNNFRGLHSEVFEGLDRTFIWNVWRGAPFKVPVANSVRGGTTALCWVTGTNDHFETLAIGSSSGFIIMWRQCSDVRTLICIGY